MPHRFNLVLIRALGRFLIIAAVFSAVDAQELPSKIRGYKVHQVKPAAKTQMSKDKGSARPMSGQTVTTGDLRVLDVGLTGITLELPISAGSVPYNGKVDFLSFHDFRVNGVNVEVEEFSTPFLIKKNEPITLPEPATVFISSPQAVKAAWKELEVPADEWLVTGRVFVFGKFRKFGFDFKRVVPVDLSFTIKNPLR